AQRRDSLPGLDPALPAAGPAARRREGRRRAPVDELSDPETGRIMFRATLRAAACAVLACALVPRSGAAQVRLIPQAGLSDQFSKFPSVGSGFSDVKKKSSFAYGAGMELGKPDKVSFRINVLRATDSEVPVGSVGCSGTDCARSTVTTATGTLVLR